MGFHFLAFWPCGHSFPFIFAFSGSASGVRQKWPVCPTSLQWIYQRQDRLHFAVFSLLGLHFLSFWPCGPSFPCILALWAFISLHFGFVGFHFLAFWPCGHSFPFILALWAFISLHFGLVGLHFLAFWPCGPSFPCILALWAFISLHFGLVGLHFLHFGLVGLRFLAIWFFRGQLLGAPPPQVAKNGPFAQRPYNGFISAVTGSILQFLAFWAFISLHFGLVGLDFLAFWPCGPSFPCILALWAFISLHFGLVGIHFLSFWPFRGQLLGSAKNGPFAQRPYNGFISARTGSILQFLGFWAFISFHFGLVGLHFLAFWPCGPSFPCILVLSAFISLHFGLVGIHFLSFWPCGPSFPCILALWAFISLHFGLVGLHFLAFWPCGPSFPCILAVISFHFVFLCGFISFHFVFFLVFWCQFCFLLHFF